MFKCDLCEDTFGNERELGFHRGSYCLECDLEWKCAKEFDKHKDQKHKFKCKICKTKFAKESTLKYHSQVWCCNNCDLKNECEYKFMNHIENDHGLPYQPDEVEANDSKHEKELTYTTLKNTCSVIHSIAESNSKKKFT